MACEPQSRGTGQASDGSTDRHRATQVSPASTAGSAKIYSSDADLVRRVYLRESDADQDLLELVRGRLRYRFLREFRRWQLDEDRIHDAYVIVLMAIREGRLRDPERLTGYILTVGQRMIIRGIRLQEVARKTPPLEEVDPIAHDSPFENRLRKEQAAVLAAALEQLPSQVRELLRRFYVLEQDEPTIRREMVLTATQFRLAKSRGKQRMVELAQELLEDRGRRQKLRAMLGFTD